MHHWLYHCLTLLTTITNLLTIHYIIVIIIIIIIIIISNAFTVLQTSLTIHKKTAVYNTWHYITYLQYTLTAYYDLHITLLKELQYNVITYRKKQQQQQQNKQKNEKQRPCN